MRKKYAFLFLLICAISKQPLLSQKINNTWFFGYHAGLDFNTSPPTPIPNTLMQADEPPYYTSSICDTSGKLLFFTNGFKVWNAEKREMTKLQGRWPWLATDDVLPLICPYPGNDSLYYLFSVGKGDGMNTGRFLFLTINMAANGNNGEIVYPQPSTPLNYYTILSNNSSFMLAGTVHCNQKDKWIATISDGVIKCLLVSSSGINAVPVITPLSISQTELNDGYSNMKFSANGEKLVIPVVSQNAILVYDFNNQAGTFSNPMLIRLPAKELLMDIELSPSGKKLYYGSYENEMDGITPTGVELHNIFQLDLENGSVANIENSRYKMNSYPDRGGCPYHCYIIHRTLQLGPDGKIYISLRDLGGIPIDKTVNVIEYPEQNKADAYYRMDYVDVKSVYKFINVNYIRSGSFSSAENGIQVKKKVCLGLPTEFSLLYTRVDSVKWDFGDPASYTNNHSTDLTTTHNYTSLGIYTVKAIIYKSCNVDTATVQISIDPDPIVHIPSYIKDTVVCVGTKLNIDAATPAATTYRWSDGLIYSYREITKAGDFLVRAYNACSSDQKSFKVKFEECPCDVFIPSAFTPNNDGLNDDFKPVTKCAAKDYRFKIFNRYGNIVFATNELNKGWNGSYKNIISATGVYIWTLEYRRPNDNKLIRTQGTVTLVR